MGKIKNQNYAKLLPYRHFVRLLQSFHSLAMTLRHSLSRGRGKSGVSKVGDKNPPSLAPAFADDMKKDTMSKDSMAKDSMAKDSMKKDTMSHDSMKKDDAMSKDGMKKDDGMMKKN